MIQVQSRAELVAFLATKDLQWFSQQDALNLGAWCQALGQTGRGTKPQLIKRIMDRLKKEMGNG